MQVFGFFFFFLISTRHYHPPHPLASPCCAEARCSCLASSWSIPRAQEEAEAGLSHGFGDSASKSPAQDKG